VIAALRDDEGALPIVAAVDHHQDAAGVEAAQRLRQVAGLLGQAHPQDIDGRAEIIALEAGLVAHRRMASIGTDDEVGADLAPAAWRAGDDADDPPALDDEVARLALHLEME